PQPLDLLAVTHMALADQHSMRAAITPPRMPTCEHAQLRAQITIRVDLSGLVPLGGAVLPDDLARPPLRDAEPLLQHVRGSTSPRRAHQFPRAISLSARFSSSLSAT